MVTYLSQEEQDRLNRGSIDTANALNAKNKVDAPVFKYDTLPGFIGPTMASSSAGVTKLNEQKATYDRLTAEPTTTTKTETPKKEEPKVNNKVTMINANGQEVTYDDWTLNRDNIKNMYSAGYHFKDGSNVPADLVNNSQSPSENTDLEQAKTDLETYTSKLQNFDVSQDPALKSILDGITSQWSSRISDMERVNKSRIGNITTTGTRLGSRYTGGSGGMFGGIISEEERQSADRITELESQKKSALAEAKSAYENKEWTKYSKLVDLAQKKYEDTLGEVKELNKATADNNAKLQERVNKENERELEVKRNKEIGGFIAQGLSPSEILEQGDFTAEEINKTMKNLAVDNGLSVDKLQGDTKNYFALKDISGALPSNITSLPEEQRLGAYLKWNHDLTTSKSASDAGNGGASNFDQFSKEQIALSVIPTQLRNSDTELKRYLEGIRQGLNEGLTPYQVADNLMGYKIENPDDFSNGMRQYMAVANLSQQEIGNVARLINSGNKSGAISVIETKLMDAQKKLDPDGYVGESTARYYNEKVASIKKTIEDAGLLDSIGPIEGSVSSVFGSVPLFRRREAAKIQAQVTSLVAEMRNHLSGTAVTDSEKKFLEPLIANLSDKKGIFINKLDEIKDNSLLRLNQVRGSAQLPSLDSEQLIDRNKRVDLYGGSQIVGNNSIDKEVDAQSNIKRFSEQNPEKLQEIQTLGNQVNPDTGQKLTYEEIWQYLSQ